MLFVNRLSRLPYWLLAAVLFGVIFLWIMLTRADYRVIITAVAKGVSTTIYVTAVAYMLATLLGLLLGLMRVSHNRAARELATFYVEIVRAVPMLVILYYIAFVGAPGLARGDQRAGPRPSPGSARLAGVGQALSPSSRCATSTSPPAPSSR